MKTIMWLIKHLKQFSSATAISSDHIDYSYADLVEKIYDYEKLLRSNGVLSGEKLVVNSEFSPDSVALMIAILALKCVYIPISSQSNVEEQNLSKISGSDWILSFNEDTSLNLNRNYISAPHKLIDNLTNSGHAVLVLFSSGSSGVPKGIVYRAESVLAKFKSKKKATVAIPFLMMDHFGGINTIFALLSSGSQIVTLRDRSIETVLAAIEKYGVKLLPTTPSFLSMLVASGLWKTRNLSSLERITYGTETMSETLLGRVTQIFPNCTFQQTYGLSEIGVLRTSSKNNNSISVKIGGAGFEYQVRKNILWIKSDYAMEGYLNAPSPFDEDGWMNTQDVVELDGEFLVIKGRETDIINVGGQKVYPAEVENVILGISEVVDVLVFGESNVVLGQSISCRVNWSRRGNESVRDIKIKIRSYCKTVLAPFKIPSKVYLTDEPLVSGRQKKVRK